MSEHTAADYPPVPYQETQAALQAIREQYYRTKGAPQRSVAEIVHLTATLHPQAGDRETVRQLLADLPAQQAAVVAALTELVSAWEQAVQDRTRREGRALPEKMGG